MFGGCDTCAAHAALPVDSLTSADVRNPHLCQKRTPLEAHNKPLRCSSTFATQPALDVLRRLCIYLKELDTLAAFAVDLYTGTWLELPLMLIVSLRTGKVLEVEGY